jgi:hypothetical protein
VSSVERKVKIHLSNIGGYSVKAREIYDSVFSIFDLGIYL